MTNYLRIDGSNFGFVSSEFHEINEKDIEIADEDYNRYFDLQNQGKQFRLKSQPSGTELFDYIEEYIQDPIPQIPSIEDRVAAMEELILSML